MGNSCTCLKFVNTEEQQIINEREEPKSRHTRSTDLEYKIDYVILLQSVARGYLERRCRLEINCSPQSSSRFSVMNRDNIQEITGTVPDFSNTATLAAERRLGPYVYPIITDDSVELIKKNAIKLDSGTIYTGE